MKNFLNSLLVVLVMGIYPAFAQQTGNSIVTTTAASEKFQTLSAVMKAAGLEDLLDGSAQFTLFAPSDLAFKDIHWKSASELLNPENKKELKALLGYHIVAGKLSASRILRALCQGRGKTTFTSIQGDIITATMDGLDIILSDSFGNTATIVVADANQSNGVIHQIDAVIRPEISK